MGVNVSTINVAANTSTGTQTITISGFGTVLGYEIFVTNAVSDGTEVPHLITSQGFCDGGDSVSVSTMEEDGVGTTNDRSRISSSAVVQMMDTAAALDGVAVHDSFTTDGFVIDWTSAPSAAWNMHVVLYGGADLQLNVGQKDSIGLGDVTVGVGFRIDAVRIAAVHAEVAGGDSRGSNVGMGGAYDTGTGIGHGYAGNFSNDDVSSTQLISFATDNASNRNSLAGPGGTTLIVSLISATSFQVTANQLASANFIWMALKSTTNKFFIGVVDSPNSTGSQSITGIGFKPQFCAMGAVLNPTLNLDLTSSANCGQMSIGFFDGTQEHCFHMKTKDNTGTSVKDMRWNSQVVFLRNNQGQGQTLYDGSFTSFDTDGFTLDMNVANGTTHHWTVFAIEENAAAPSTFLKDPVLTQGVVPFAR